MKLIWDEIEQLSTNLMERETVASICLASVIHSCIGALLYMFYTLRRIVFAYTIAVTTHRQRLTIIYLCAHLAVENLSHNCIRDSKVLEVGGINKGHSVEVLFMFIHHNGRKETKRKLEAIDVLPNINRT